MRSNIKHEILSPVGDEKTFYMAIRSGADAVYMGLNKYNARMKAENINLDNLPALVRYAHLKNVKVYITLNTILFTSEILDVCEMVETCLRAGVDAFIVQDVGLISYLKSRFPDITLHGSTQLGVHNKYGAKIAKELGLTRVVLSRECTLEDIKDIADNVDIELEVFVQGAMCVCFSGNCYMSSLKHNASGNRGECKQLCRLPYTMTDSTKTTTGYILSPRDNCMLSSLKELLNLGVCSFKIEGRLRHLGYIGIATNVYREVMDSILNNTHCNLDLLESRLKRVFSRGEYIRGYNDSNNIIDVVNNNHVGVKIGKVVSCQRFKDIFKITIQSDTSINCGDGLKFEFNNFIQSMGVGNVDKNGNNYIVYGKNNISTGSIVYKALDVELENDIKDYSRKIKTNVYLEALVGNRIKLEYSAFGYTATVYGDICESARNSPMSEESFIKQLSKIDKDIYEIEKFDIVTDGVFVAVSKLNELRRDCIAKLEKLLLETSVTLSDKIPAIIERQVSYDTIAIVNEHTNLKNIASIYSSCIFSPTEYSIDIINTFKNLYTKYFDAPLIINLPIIARVGDIKVIDNIIEYFKSDNTIFVANNIYALNYINFGARLWAGSGLNIINDYSASKYIELGCEEIIGSVEKWSNRLSDTYKLVGNNVLMTFAHCPFKTLYNNNCNDCKHSGKLLVKSNNSTMRVIRQKISNCYFELIESRDIKNQKFSVIDLR